MYPTATIKIPTKPEKIVVVEIRRFKANGSHRDCNSSVGKIENKVQLHYHSN
jgi:hypothetical protein